MEQENKRKILLINTLEEEISARVLEEKPEATGNAYQAMESMWNTYKEEK